MKSVKLTLDQKTDKGLPVDPKKTPPLVDFEMKVVDVLTMDQSLYRFRVGLGAGNASIEFYLDAAEASDFFSYLDSIVYGIAAEQFLMVSTMDATGNAAGQVKISIVPLTPTPFTDPGNSASQITVVKFAFSPAAAPLEFLLTNSEYVAMFYFFDCMLQSNPPNPPY